MPEKKEKQTRECALMRPSPPCSKKGGFEKREVRSICAKGRRVGSAEKTILRGRRRGKAYSFVSTRRKPASKKRI